MSRRRIALIVNGRAMTVAADPASRLSDVLREELQLIGTKVGCDAGDCGACTVLLDGAQICACMVPAARAEGRRIETVEGLADDPAMRKLQVPVVFDGTHSAQLPGGLGTASGGQREFVPFLTRAAVAAGVDGIFLEVHPDPDAGLCDGPNMLALKDLPPLLREVRAIDRVVKATAE